MPRQTIHYALGMIQVNRQHGLYTSTLITCTAGLCYNHYQRRFRLVQPITRRVLATPDDAPEGYLLEGDAEYPKEPHDIHSDYPLAPETMAIPESWLSYYTQTLVNKLGGKFTECEKLVPNLHNKERYEI